MKTKITFDEAIPILLAYLVEEGFDPSCDGSVLRDGFGRVAFILRDALPAKKLRRHQKDLAQALGPYADEFGALQTPAMRVSEVDHSKGLSCWELVNGKTVRFQLMERRFFGQDWLRTPADPDPDLPPMLTFGSLKGGVGRSTALFALAIELARSGKNVLIVDLDLEAPGLAALTLEPELKPRFGVIDYLVETSFREIEAPDLEQFVATSRLTDYQQGSGRVDLLPATGTASLDRPRNVLAKLSRAMLEAPGPEGPESLSTRVLEMIRRFAARTTYDAILVDARAGLAELSAAPLLSLGSTVALFGTDSPHTFEGYSYLMAHMASLPLSGSGRDWRERIKFVHAKAGASTESRGHFEDRLYDVLSRYFYEQDEGEDSFTFSLEEEGAPHKPWRIFFNSQFLDLDPLKDPELLEKDVMRATYGSFLDSAIAALGLDLNSDASYATI